MAQAYSHPLKCRAPLTRIEREILHRVQHAALQIGECRRSCVSARKTENRECETPCRVRQNAPEEPLRVAFDPQRSKVGPTPIRAEVVQEDARMREKKWQAGEHAP